MSKGSAGPSSSSNHHFDDALKEVKATALNYKTFVYVSCLQTKFGKLLFQIKEIEKKDSVLTSKHQIDRLLRPGSTYFNLNPFEVLQLEHKTPIEEIKKKYKRLSILVHPDKNQDDVERAQTAFELINRAWKVLENDVTRKRCLDVYEASPNFFLIINLY